MSGFFTEFQDDLVARSAQLSGPAPSPWRLRGRRAPRIRGAAGAFAVLATAGGIAGIATTSASSDPVAVAPKEVVEAVPALKGSDVRVPDLVRRAFANANSDTANGALARPVIAALPDGSVSWVAPTADGACLGVPDTGGHAMAVSCATTEEINRRGLALSTFAGDPETGPGTEIGVGGHPAHAEADGSYMLPIRR